MPFESRNCVFCICNMKTNSINVREFWLPTSVIWLLWNNKNMPWLSEVQRNTVISHLEVRKCKSVVARTFKVYQNTITRLWNRHPAWLLLPRIIAYGYSSYANGPPLQPPRRQYRVRVEYLSEPCGTFYERQVFVTDGLFVVSFWCSNIATTHRWCRVHTVWPRLRWRHGWFSDESRFLLHRHDGRWNVFRHRLRPHVVPIMSNSNSIYQHDARPHTARLTTAFL